MQKLLVMWQQYLSWLRMNDAGVHVLTFALSLAAVENIWWIPISKFNQNRAKLGFFFNSAFLRQSITIFNLKKPCSHKKKSFSTPLQINWILNVKLMSYHTIQISLKWKYIKRGPQQSCQKVLKFNWSFFQTYNNFRNKTVKDCKNHIKILFQIQIIQVISGMISNIFNGAKIDEKFKLKFSAVLEDQQKVHWNKIGSSFLGRLSI